MSFSCFAFLALIYADACRACPAMGPHLCGPCPDHGPGYMAPHCVEQRAYEAGGGYPSYGEDGAEGGAEDEAVVNYYESSSGSSSSNSNAKGGSSSGSNRVDSASSSNMLFYIVGGTLMAGIIAGAIWHRRKSSQQKQLDGGNKPIAGSVARRMEEGVLKKKVPARTTFISGVDNRVATLSSIPPRASGGFVEMSSNYARA